MTIRRFEVGKSSFNHQASFLTTLSWSGTILILWSSFVLYKYFFVNLRHQQNYLTYTSTPLLENIFIMEEGGRRKKSGKKPKKSGVRTKFLIESLRRDYYALRDENDRLREIVQTNLPKRAADAILADCFDLTSPAVNVASIDDLTNKVPGMSIAEEDDDYE
jgi:hypothetical protein